MFQKIGTSYFGLALRECCWGSRFRYHVHVHTLEQVNMYKYESILTIPSDGVLYYSVIYFY